MPLPLIGPVSVNSSVQTGPTKHAVAIRLSEEVIRAIKEATAIAASGGPSPLQVQLTGNAPGITVNGVFYPITLSAERIHELYSRKRHPNPTKPIHHRPPFNYEAQVHAKATVTRVLDASITGKLRDKYTQAAEKDGQKRTILLGEAPVQVKPKKKRPTAATASSASASSLARQAATNGMSNKAAASSSGRSTPTGAPKASLPAKPTTADSSPFGPSSPHSLRTRVVHALALKPMPARELIALTVPSSEAELSDVLRTVAENTQASTKPTNSHWAPGYSSGAKADGLWKLKQELYEEVGPFTWSSYDPSERRRIADDTKDAFDRLGLPADALERKKLRVEEKRWMAAVRGLKAGDDGDREKSTISKKPQGPPAVRKVKMKNLTEPPAAGGSVLSAKFRGGQTQGMVQDGGATKKSTKPKAPAVRKDKAQDSDWASDAGGPSAPRPLVPPSSPPKKRPSPPAAQNTTLLAPPAQIHSSRTPPPPLHSLPAKPSSSLPAKPLASPRPLITGVSSSQPVAKRKRDDADDPTDDLGSSSRPLMKTKMNGAVSDRLGEGSDAMSGSVKKRRVEAGTVVKTKGGHEKVAVKKPPMATSSSAPTVSNTSSKSSGLPINGRSGQNSGKTTKTSTPVPESPKNRVNSTKKRDLSALTGRASPSAQALPPRKKELLNNSAFLKNRTEARLAMAMYTDSEEEEDESEAAPPPKAKASRPTNVKSPPERSRESSNRSKASEKTSRERSRSPFVHSSQTQSQTHVRSIASSISSSSSSQSGLGIRSLPPRRAPGPLPTDPDELKERWFEDYAVYSSLYASIQLETTKLEKALRQVQNGDVSTEAAMADMDALEDLRKRYADMHDEMLVIRDAMVESRGPV